LFPVMFFFFVRNFPLLMAFYWIFYSLIGAAIMYPILRKWSKKDQAEIEAKRAQRAAEEEEKHAKKAAAKEAARKNKQRKPAKPNYQEEKGSGGEEEELEDEDEEVEEEADPEKRFRKWLKENGYIVRKKKMKRHPYSAEEEIVALVYDEKGWEKDLEALRKEFISTQNMPQAPTSLGDLFSFSNRKNKKANENQDETNTGKDAVNELGPTPSSETKTDADDLDKKKE